MSVSLSAHGVDRVLVELRHREGFHWTNLRMVDAAGKTIFEVVVFAENTSVPVRIIDERLTAEADVP